MPKRFSTEAANADVMGEDAQVEGVPAGMPQAIGADGTPRDPADRTLGREAKGDAKADAGKDSEPKDGEAKPGKDVSAAGIVKDKDAG